MIDRHELLATLRPLVTQLEESIRERALATPEVAAHLEHEHHKAVVAERTAMSMEEWRDGEITQAAVAWVLACVFVRFLEDNGLIDQALISGPVGRRAAALGHREEHFRLHPEHSDREYLEACFRAVAAFPAVAPLFDELHNPLWRLAPTADGARALRETFTAIDPGTGVLAHDFTDADLNTRFLGDLYQDLSDAARKRYALLQTPQFVESFILDRTLMPAIDEFGLQAVSLIDPTCGSGHFLIGAFQRLFALWMDREPGTSPAALAQRTLDQIAGVDLNPYATAIARFRMIITALRVCGIARLAEAPAFTVNLATGDSLLHGPLPEGSASVLFDANRLNKHISHVYDTEDAADLARILGRPYHVVVGNPPYIAGDDSTLREAYRSRYSSCHREFALTVPFMERFFELATLRDSASRSRPGYVGQITGNNFMKREFGSRLVERFLPSVEVDTLIDAAGAYIPGHGTPTVIVIGRGRPPAGDTVRVVEGLRGEPTQPSDPASGLVWSSIVRLVDTAPASDEFVRVSDVSRKDLWIHPMILGPGRTLKAQLDSGADQRVADVAIDLGYTGQTNIDDMMLRPRRAWLRAGVTEELVTRLAVGDAIRDWRLESETAVWFPYRHESLVPVEELGAALRAVWPWRTTAWARRTFSKHSYREDGRPWHEWHQIALKRHRTPLTLAWAFVATHNHFALDRGGTVFKQSAPFIKLADAATGDDYLRLAAALNSSLACFWLKQVAQNRGSTIDARGARQRTQAWEDFYEVPAGRVADFPIRRDLSIELAQELDELARERAAVLTTTSDLTHADPLSERLEWLQRRDRDLTGRMMSAQEELDWQVLTHYGLVPSAVGPVPGGRPPLSFGERAFEFVLARQLAGGTGDTTWFERHGATPTTELPPDWPDAYRAVVEQRIALIDSNVDVGLIERPEHKRRWNRPPWADRQREALTGLVLDALDAPELWADFRPRSTAELTDVLRTDPLLVEALELLSDQKDEDLATTVRRLVVDAAVPQVAAQRFTEKGMRKHDSWERVWQLQRAEDRGDDVGSIAVPPKYALADFRSPVYWRYRGKLDVSTEPFVLLPHAERGSDASPVVGWGGWDERDLARALAGRVMELREQEAASGERLAPLLAGVVELLPWIHQWHPGSDQLYGGPPGQYFESWLDGQLAELGITRDNLRAWRPSAPARGRKAKAGAA